MKRNKRHKEVLYATVLVDLRARNWEMAVPMAADLVKESDSLAPAYLRGEACGKC